MVEVSEKSEMNLKYLEIKVNIESGKYFENNKNQDVVTMSKPLYPQYFTFDKTKGTRWNEEKVKEENQKIRESLPKPKTPFEKGSPFYKDLIEYVKLYGFNEEQAEVLVSSDVVSRIKTFSCMLDYVKRLATVYIGILEHPVKVNETITRTFVTKAELETNYKAGIYNFDVDLYPIKKLFNENYIFDLKESIKWNKEQVALNNIIIENDNKLMPIKREKVRDRLERDQVSYLFSLGLTLEQVESLYYEITDFNAIFYYLGYDYSITSLLEPAVFNVNATAEEEMIKLNYFADLLINLRAKA
jgi:hypothetical protein